MPRKLVCGFSVAWLDGEPAFLLVDKHGIAITPGGKDEPEDNGDERQTLLREFRQELPGLVVTIVGEAWPKHFTGKSLVSNEDIVIIVYDIQVVGQVVAAAEVSNARYVRNADLGRIPISQQTQEIIAYWYQHRREVA